MFSAVSEALISKLTEALYPCGVRSVIYGTPELIPVTAQPAALFCATDASAIPVGAVDVPITLSFKLYILTTLLADNYTATCAAQDLYWRYPRTAEEEEGGVALALLDLNNSVLTDRLGREWIMTFLGAARFSGLQSGKNYTGEIDIDFNIKTYVHRG